MRPQPAQRAPQFAPGAWNLWVLALVGGLAYATYWYSPWLGWSLLAFGQHLTHNPHFLRPSTASAFVTVVRAVATVGVVLALARFLPASTPAAVGFRPPTRGNLGFAATAFVVLMLISIVVNFLLYWANATTPDPYAVAIASHRGWTDYASDLVTVAIATPIVEETLFRGLLFAGLAQRVPAWLAALFSALVFAMWHEQPLAIIQLFIMGLVLTFAYYRTRTLWVSIAVHAGNNAFWVTLWMHANSLKP